MTGIVLCEISSGLSIVPSRIPDGILGESTPVTFTALGAVGKVTWSVRPEGYPDIYHPPWPFGRTLTDNGDGTATDSGTYGRLGDDMVYLEARDSVGQIATIKTGGKVSPPGPWAAGWISASTLRVTAGGFTDFTVSLSGAPPGWTIDDTVVNGGVNVEIWQGGAPITSKPPPGITLFAVHMQGWVDPHRAPPEDFYPDLADLPNW